MTQAIYDEIIDNLYKLTTKKEKCEYLLSVIEPTDYDENGLNDNYITSIKNLHLLKKQKNNHIL